jgi:hypothetical protein
MQNIRCSHKQELMPVFRQWKMTKKATFLQAARLPDEDLGRLMIVEPRSEHGIETVQDQTMIVEVEGARDGDLVKAHFCWKLGAGMTLPAE